MKNMIKSNGQINALVAGGAGFIGSHLCDRLIKNGYRILCIDNLYTGRIENVCHLQRDVRFSFVNQDVTVSINYDDISLVFSLACPASPIHYQKDAVYTTKTAVLGVLNLLEVARGLIIAKYYRLQQVKSMATFLFICKQKTMAAMLILL